MADDAADPSDPERLPKKRTTVLSRIPFFVKASVVSLIVAVLYERIGEALSLEGAITAAAALQAAFTVAIAQLSWMHFLTYVSDSMMSVSQIFAWLSPLFSWVPQGLFAIVRPIAFYVSMILALALLPLTVFREGNWFEKALIVIVYVPSYFALRRSSGDDTAPGSSLGLAIIVTVAFYWLLQLLLTATNFVFGQVIAFAQVAVGGSAIASAVAWAISKRTEDIVHDRALDVLRPRERQSFLQAAARLSDRMRAVVRTDRGTRS